MSVCFFWVCVCVLGNNIDFHFLLLFIRINKNKNKTNKLSGQGEEQSDWIIEKAEHRLRFCWLTLGCYCHRPSSLSLSYTNKYQIRTWYHRKKWVILLEIRITPGGKVPLSEFLLYAFAHLQKYSSFVLC